MRDPDLADTVTQDARTERINQQELRLRADIEEHTQVSEFRAAVRGRTNEVPLRPQGSGPFRAKGNRLSKLDGTVKAERETRLDSETSREETPASATTARFPEEVLAGLSRAQLSQLKREGVL